MSEGFDVGKMLVLPKPLDCCLIAKENCTFIFKRPTTRSCAFFEKYFQLAKILGLIACQALQ